MKEYGAYFKEIRTGKGLTLRETADGIVSYQFLSNFENGRSNISLYNFIELLDRVNLTFNEFLVQAEASTDYLLTEFIREDSRLIDSNNLVEQKQLIQSLQTKYQQTGKIKYLHLQIIAELDFAHNLQNVQPKEYLDQQRAILKDYLLKIESWTNYELFLYSHANYIFSVDEIKPVYKKIYLRIKKQPRIMQDFYLYVDGFMIATIYKFVREDCLEEAQEALQFYKINDEKDFQLQHFGNNVYYRFAESQLEIRLGKVAGLRSACNILNALHLLGDYRSVVNHFYAVALNNLQKTNEKATVLPQTIDLVDEMFVVVEQD